LVLTSGGPEARPRKAGITAMLGSTLIVYQGEGLPAWLRDGLLILAIPVAIAGWVMTFRDLSQPIKRRR
jgi:hypothetical protein